MAVHVIDEANRCLQCKKPMCQQGCPIHTPIPAMIKALKEGGLEEAGAMLFSNNPMSLVCSLVCNHERQCEGHCVLGRKGQPVHVSSIENYISDTCLERIDVQCQPKNGKKVAVIGAGPAGITIAILLTKKGYSVTIFDSRDKIGGVLQYGIPEFRLPKAILERYKKKLLSMGIRIRPNTTIGGALEIKDLFRDGYESIFIGTGVWRPKKLGIKGESLGNVHFAIDYLANPDAYDLGDRVAVIGVGNSAMDVARTVIRKGSHHVTLYARGSHSDASLHETQYAMLDGAKFEFSRNIVEINDNGPVFQQILYDEEGNVTGYSGEKEQVYADSVIISISQGPKSKLVNTTEGLKATRNGLLQTDEQGETTVEGIFASGDVVLGAKTVVEAVAYSKTVADAMDAYMKKKDMKEKNKKDENEGFEDFDDEKIFQVNTGNDNDGNKKVTITFNRRKAKDVTDKAVDKVADVTDKVKDIVTEKVGEENIEKVMDKVDEAKDKAMDAKDVFVEKVGEENIQMAKDKVKNVVNQAKDIVSEFVGKDDYEEVYTHDFNEDDFVDEDAVNEDVETEDDVDLGESDDLLKDEVEDL